VVGLRVVQALRFGDPEVLVASKAPDPGAAERRGVRVAGIEQVQFAPADKRRLVVRALGEAAAGRIRPVIGQIFPLERAADAHAAIEARRVIGKTLLLI